jgi:hypothetical protein
MQRFSGKYSQHGEQGIIDEALSRIGISIGTCCEFGSADGYYCSNTRHLVDKGWTGTFLEAKRGELVTPENVNELVPDVDVLSIDIDGDDFGVWQAYKGRPKIVVIEVNSSIPEGVYHFSHEHGSSYSMMNMLAESKGYYLIYHTGNCIYVLNEYKELFEPGTFCTDHLKKKK